MKLEIFNHVATRQTAQFRTIGMNSKNGKIQISRKLAEDLRIQSGDTIYFARDTDSRNDWYFTVKKEDPLGIRIVEKVTGKGSCTYKTFGGCNRKVSEALLKDCKIAKGATFLVAEKPVIVDGTEWWGILAAKPFRIS